MSTQRKTRMEVPVEQTWDLTDLFSNQEAWVKEVQSIQNNVGTVTKYKGKLGQDEQTLLKCLQAAEALQKQIIKVSTYASLRSSSDGTNPSNQRDSAIVQAVLARVGAELSFLEPEILSIPTDKVQQFLEREELQPYKKLITDILDKKPYVLTPDIEGILAAFGEVHQSPYMIYERSKSSDMVFEKILDEKGNHLPMSFALYEDQYELTPNTTIRRNAYDSFINTLQRYKNTYAATYATEVTKQVTEASIRGYQSVTDMLLAQQQVTKEMYHNQLDVIFNQLAPHMRRYIKLKQRKLGVDKMYVCDLQVPMDPSYQPETTFKEASEVILDALSILGPAYKEMVHEAFNNRWVDYADNVGKSTGAFCSSPYGVHPYILITWTDTMRGAFVLAHELGHAGHFYLAGKHQSLANMDPSMYFIEAPSTMNELLLADYLMEQTDDNRMKQWVIDQLLGTYYHNFVTHLLEGEFQRRVYTLAEKGTPLTADVLCEVKKNALEEFWGDTVVIDEGASLTWMRQPHYYMGLYPYTYSAGLTVSTAVKEQIKKEGQPAIDRWLDVLKTGGKYKPLELIKKAGIDMTKPDPIVDAVNYVGSLIDQLDSGQDA